MELTADALFIEVSGQTSTESSGTLSIDGCTL